MRPPRRLLDEYAAYVAGFENVEAQTAEVGGRIFALVQVALDGEVTSQYLLVEGGTLYTLTIRISIRRRWPCWKVFLRRRRARSRLC